MSSTPLVSICMVTYNHEKYVGEAIRSALGQSFTDLELVVVNDGSTDGTAAEIGRFADPRLVVIHQKNQGPPTAANSAIAASRGKYVALFSGDDVCHPDRIRRQLEEYGRGGRRVLFSQCDFIDDDGWPLGGGHFAERMFHFGNLPRRQILARFLYQGNYLNSITPFTERDVFLEAPYDPCLLQLQDYDLWVRLVKKYELYIMPDALLHYRIRANAANLSSPTRGGMLRNNNEYYLVLRRFFDGTTPDQFREAFAGELVNPDFADGPEFACEQAFAYGRSKMPVAKLIGIERLHDLMNDPVTAEVLEKQYAFGTRQFFNLLATVDLMEPPGGNVSALYFDTGSGWDAAKVICRPISPTIEKIDLTFTLPPSIRPHALRWDPVEMLTCRVRLEAIELLDSAGATRSVDLATVESNGRRLADGTVSFATADPMFCWEIDGAVSAVTIRGRWETDDALQSAANQSRQMHKLDIELAATKSALADTQRVLQAMRNTHSWRLMAPLRAAASVARRLRAG